MGQHRPEPASDIRLCDDHSRAECPEIREPLVRLIEDARTIGCERAIEKHGHNVEYLTDLSRAKYLEILNITTENTVVEIGASMGQHTRLIAPRCKMVEALEVVPEQAVFADLWCRQSGFDNVRVTAGGASGTLPYDDQYADVAIMNYVLEWCGGRSPTNPASFHRRLLSEVFRILRPGGRLFLSTKNRYGLRLVTGGYDEHVGIKFGSALPRWLQRTLADPTKVGKPGGFLHSRGQIERLMRSAGFSDLDAFLFFPDARFPQHIVTFDRQGLRDLAQQVAHHDISKLDKLYFSLPDVLKKNVAASHAYIATKS